MTAAAANVAQLQLVETGRNAEETTRGTLESLMCARGAN